MHAGPWFACTLLTFIVLPCTTRYSRLNYWPTLESDKIYHLSTDMIFNKTYANFLRESIQAGENEDFWMAWTLLYIWRHPIRVAVCIHHFISETWSSEECLGLSRLIGAVMFADLLEIGIMWWLNLQICCEEIFRFLSTENLHATLFARTN